MTVFHNLCRDDHEISAPPLDCARSGYLHTICSVVTKEKISSLRLRLLSQQHLAKFSHRQDLTVLPSHQQHLRLLRPQATPVPPASASFTPANCASSISVLQVSCFCKSYQFHQDSTQQSGSWISCMVFELVTFDFSTLHSCRSPSADCNHLTSGIRKRSA